MARYLVKTVVGFGLFEQGERLLVNDEFLERFGRWLNVIEPVDEFLVEDDFEGDLAAFGAGEKGLTKEPDDGKDDHLQGAGRPVLAPPCPPEGQ